MFLIFAHLQKIGMARKYMAYPAAQVAKAVNLVRNGHPIRRAAATCKVPESTIRVRLKKPCQNPGRPPVLSKEEEMHIVNWIISSANVGLPVDGQRLKTSVAHLFKLSGKKNPFMKGIPGRKWFAGFLKRHQQISRRIPSALSKQRVTVTETKIRAWFGHIQSYFDKNQLHHVAADPSRVFNMDESAIRLVPTREQVLAKTGEKYVHTKCANSDKEAYTTLFASNADGILAPPLVLFPYKQRLPAEIVREAPPGWSVGKTESGWMNRETFYYYLKNVFHPWLLATKIQLPIIVFVDGHSSHVSYQTTEFCRENGIELICLFPNATHILQPLDVGFFRALKSSWNKRLIEWRTLHAGDAITKHEFTPLLKKAVDDMLNIKTTLRNAFRKCGLVPWDPNAVNFSMVLQPQHSEQGNDGACIESSQEGSTHTNLLTDLENYLNVGQLKLFIKHKADLEWPGPVEDKNLFHVWQRIIKKNARSQIQQTNLTSQMMHSMDLMNRFLKKTLLLMLADERQKTATFLNFDLPRPSQTTFLEETTNTSKSSLQPVCTQDREDFMERAFRIPTVFAKPPKCQKLLRPRPPTVATSDEFREWLITTELNKENKERERVEKKAARVKKSEQKKKAKTGGKAKTTKPRM
ncbi:uncharacterized protein LOC134212139 [Armigeres subalbatus]|uniref:uncharacterized protein LOC134212139 n=1 Tax=Armigeres subalbatus TaxID=124917 RepID=UPI002ED25126